MQPIPTMITPSASTTAVFVALVVGVCVLFWLGARQASIALGESADQTRRVSLVTGLALVAWLGLTAAISASGLLERKLIPPPLALFALLSLAVPALVASSRVGARMARGLPIVALVGAQAFRLPLELVLHAWKNQGVLPVQMTFEGHNFDIVTGVLALLLAAWLYKRAAPRAVLWLFNGMGSALLLAVTTIAVLSSPLPIRQYTNEPAVLLAFHFPYGWILPFCVGGALCGHILVFRWLLENGRAPRAATLGSSASRSEASAPATTRNLLDTRARGYARSPHVAFHHEASTRDRLR